MHPLCRKDIAIDKNATLGLPYHRNLAKSHILYRMYNSSLPLSLPSPLQFIVSPFLSETRTSI